MSLILIPLVCSLVGLISSTVYLALVLKAVWRFRAVNRSINQEQASALPPVSVLKPLRGLEPFLERNLESFFLQDYPDFELIFGLRDDTDAALEIVRALSAKYPNVKARIVFSGEPEYANAKVFVMQRMMDAASASYFVITDSDVQVAADCLRRVTA